MIDVAKLIEDMVLSGVPADIVGRTAAALAERGQAVDVSAERRRAADRERKREERLRKSADSADSADAKKVSPDTPFEENNHTPPKEPLKGFQKVPPPSTKGARLPEHFEPSEADALATGLDRRAIAEERLKFRDYWRAQPGQRGVKTDWPATWRNWCRKAAADRGLKPPAKAAAPPPDAVWRQRASKYAAEGWYREWGSPRDIPPEFRDSFPNLEIWRDQFPAMDQTEGRA